MINQLNLQGFDAVPILKSDFGDFPDIYGKWEGKKLTDAVVIEKLGIGANKSTYLSVLAEKYGIPEFKTELAQIGSRFYLEEKLERILLRSNSERAYKLEKVLHLLGQGSDRLKYGKVSYATGAEIPRLIWFDLEPGTDLLKKYIENRNPPSRHQKADSGKSGENSVFPAHNQLIFRGNFSGVQYFSASLKEIQEGIWKIEFGYNSEHLWLPGFEERNWNTLPWNLGRMALSVENDLITIYELNYKDAIKKKLVLPDLPAGEKRRVETNAFFSFPSLEVSRVEYFQVGGKLFQNVYCLDFKSSQSGIMPPFSIWIDPAVGILKGASYMGEELLLVGGEFVAKGAEPAYMRNLDWIGCLKWQTPDRPVLGLKRGKWVNKRFGKRIGNPTSFPTKLLSVPAYLIWSVTFFPFLFILGFFKGIIQPRAKSMDILRIREAYLKDFEKIIAYRNMLNYRIDSSHYSLKDLQELWLIEKSQLNFSQHPTLKIKDYQWVMVGNIIEKIRFWLRAHPGHEEEVIPLLNQIYLVAAANHMGNICKYLAGFPLTVRRKWIFPGFDWPVSLAFEGILGLGLMQQEKFLQFFNADLPEIDLEQLEMESIEKEINHIERGLPWLARTEKSAGGEGSSLNQNQEGGEK